MQWPLMDAYVELLPGRWDAYPDHVQKASVYREFLVGTDLLRHADALPPPVRGLLVNPVPLSSWIPEVHVSGLMCALADSMDGEDAFLAHSYRANRRLLSGPAYAFLFRLLGARTVLRGARSRWTQLHRGITFQLDWGEERTHAQLTMGFPAHLVPPLAQRSYTAAFRAALEVAGSANVDVRITRCSPTEAQYTAQWK